MRRVVRLHYFDLFASSAPVSPRAHAVLVLVVASFIKQPCFLYCLLSYSIPVSTSFLARMDHPERFHPIQETLDAMRHREVTTYNVRRCQVGTTHHHKCKTTSIWRFRLVEWMSTLARRCHLQRSSVVLASWYLDVSIQGGLCRDRPDFQLAAATCLQLALKAHDTCVINRDKLVLLGGGAFMASDISRMELQILKLLQWHLHPSTVYCYLQQFERLWPLSMSDTCRKVLHQVTQLLADLTVLEEQYLPYDPRILSYAILLFVVDLAPHQLLSVHLRQTMVVRMMTVARLQSRSKDVLQVFDTLKESLHQTDHLDDLISYLNEASETGVVQPSFDLSSLASSSMSSSDSNASGDDAKKSRPLSSSTTQKEGKKEEPKDELMGRGVSPCSVSDRRLGVAQAAAAASACSGLPLTTSQNDDDKHDDHNAMVCD